MNIAITDANVFIDLFELELLPLLFELNLAIHTTQEVVLECDKIQRKQLQIFVDKKQLHVHRLTDAQVQELTTLSFSSKLSFSDQTILWLAYQEKSSVLSGDKMIRKWCKKNNLEVHGILWVIEQFIEQDLLPAKIAILKMELLLKINLWLPSEICEKMIEKWKKVI